LSFPDLFKRQVIIPFFKGNADPKIELREFSGGFAMFISQQILFYFSFFFLSANVKKAAPFETASSFYC
jgi:hypothetical protein